MLNLSTPRWPKPPRDWQSEAFAAAQAHFGQPNPEPVIGSAIMGAGKAMLIGAICGAAQTEAGEVIVVSTSSVMLVNDLQKTIEECTGETVGTWYTHRKRLARIVVACVPSVGALARKLQSREKRVALWIADEVHRTECSTILKEYETLNPAHALGVTATPFRSDKWEAISLFHHVLFRYGVSGALKDGVVVPWRISHSEAGGNLDKACMAMIAGATGPGLANAVNIKDAEEFAAMLTAAGIESKAIHSHLSMSKRMGIMSLLENGKLRCVVHVNLLAEGANFPWLRWLCLRRQVDSRVRFIQEIGRLLRSHPGKADATFYDPHDLFGHFNLTYAEALGEPPEKPECQIEMPLGEAMARTHDADPAVAIAALESIVRSLVVACEASGTLANRKTLAKADRLKPSTSLQHVAVSEAARGALQVAPHGWIACLQDIVGEPSRLRFGFAADLIVALWGVRDAGRWPAMDAGGRISVALGVRPCGQMVFEGAVS